MKSINLDCGVYKIKRKRFCKNGKHQFLGMAGDICKNCDYVGFMGVKPRKRKRTI